MRMRAESGVPMSRSSGCVATVGAMEQQPPLQPWIRKSTTHLAKTRIFTLEEHEYASPKNGGSAGFAVINSPDWVNIFAITPEDQVVLVEQFRFGVGTLSLEVPGGIVDPDESPAETAARELVEETGYSGSAPVLLGSMSANAAILNNQFHTYLVRDAVLDRPQALDEHEEIRVVLRPRAELGAMIRRGEIHHSVIVAAWALLELHEQSG